MQVRLAYGEDGLDVSVPDDAVVVRAAQPPVLADEQGAVADAVRPHLAGLVTGAPRVVVVFPDITRPMPNRTVLPPLLAELEALGAGPDRVTLLCATGTHRVATAAELEALIGPRLIERYPVVQHDCIESAHVEVGAVDGVPVRIDARYVGADVKIVTGFVEPHFFAGFSGGPKGVCPGLADMSTVLEAHSPARIADPGATWTVLDGNPVHEFVRSAAALAPPDLSVDVAIDGERRLTAVFAGRLPDSHLAACAHVQRTAVRTVPGRFDVVVSTNGGHPLDRNLYQAVKGMAAAERVVRPGGTIIMAASCVDGLPAGSPFARLLERATTAEELLRPGGPATPEGWQTQVLGRVLAQARVELFCDGISAEDVTRAQLVPVADVSEAVARATGPGDRVCVLPLGPLTVATPGR